MQGLQDSDQLFLSKGADGPSGGPVEALQVGLVGNRVTEDTCGVVAHRGHVGLFLGSWINMID